MSQLKLVFCTRDYWEFVRQLRTDPRTVQGFLCQDPITPEQHQAYMEQHWGEYKIALLDRRPVGYVGIVGNDIRVCVDPECQRQGVGTFLVREMIRGRRPCQAVIKYENRASRALFERCGFQRKLVVYEAPS